MTAARGQQKVSQEFPSISDSWDSDFPLTNHCFNRKMNYFLFLFFEFMVLCRSSRKPSDCASGHQLCTRMSRRLVLVRHKLPVSRQRAKVAIATLCNYKDVITV